MVRVGSDGGGRWVSGGVGAVALFKWGGGGSCGGNSGGRVSKVQTLKGLKGSKGSNVGLVGDLNGIVL